MNDMLSKNRRLQILRFAQDDRLRVVVILSEAKDLYKPLTNCISL